MHRIRRLVASLTVGLAALAGSALAPVGAPPAEAAGSMWVSGYYAGWATSAYPPSAIDFSSLTHIMVFSVLPRTDGTLDTTMFMGATSGPAMARDVAARAHAAGKQAILTVGGAGYAANFQAATSSANIDRFVASLVQTVSDWGYDGVDIDWEPLTPTDWAPMLSLVSKLRAARPGMLITADVGWLNSNFAMSSSEKAFYAQLGGAVDQMNMMNYGMADAWSGWASWHSSALQGHGSNHPSSVANSAAQYIAAGVPAAKLGMGIGFYGSCWSAPVTAPLQSPSGSRVVATPNYVDIMRSYYRSDAYRYDSAAQAPYLSFASATGPSGCTFVSYEDETSIAAKGAYAAQAGLGGTIIWHLAAGYVPQAADPGALLRAVGSAFLGGTPRASTSTALGVTPAAPVTGQSVTLSATVSSASGVPDGSVTFRDGTTTLATVTAVNGQAQYTTTTLAPGTHSLSALYGGSSGYAPSTSASVSLSVAPASTTVTLTSSLNPVPVRKSVTFTAVVAPVAPGAGTPTGLVRFMDGTKQIASVNLVSGKATYSTSKLARGAHAIKAVYAGSAAYATSTSGVLTQTVT